jgi:hypothetical protein
MLVRWTYFYKPGSVIEPWLWPERLSGGLGISRVDLKEAGMTKVLRFPASISASPISSDTSPSKKPRHDVFVSVALFSAIGLLASLVAILFGQPGAWY